MANSEKNIVITPNKGSLAADPKIVFSGADASTAAQNITLTALPTNGGTLNIAGTVGTMLNLSNSINTSYGSLFSVNDMSGVPIFNIPSSNGSGSTAYSTLYTGLTVGGGFQVYNNAYISGSFSVGGATTMAAISSSSTITAMGNIIAYYSDARLKNFVGTIPNALDKVSQLNGYYFYGNETAKSLGYDAELKQVGVSAQEVDAVLPEIVVPAPINDSIEGADYKTVYYDKLVPLLIEAIKELNQKIIKLESKI